MADRYWVGGSATWDATAGTKWALTSGGAGGQTVPGTGDNVFLDANSGAVTVTVSGARNTLNLDCTGFTGTLTGTSTPSITIFGTVCTFSSGMTLNSTVGPSFFTGGSSPITLTTNGKALRELRQNSTFTGHGFVLQDHLTVVGVLNIAFGTFDANDFNVTIGGFSSTGTGGRVTNMGNGAWTINGAQLVLWDMTTVTNATLNAEGSTLTVNMGITGANTFITGLKVNSPVTLNARTVANSRFNISGSGGLADLTVIGPNSLDMAGSTVIDNARLLGTGAGQIHMASSGVGSARTITVSGAITGQYVGVRDCTKAGAGTIEFAPGWDLGNTTGVTTSPKTPRLQNVMGI